MQTSTSERTEILETMSNFDVSSLTTAERMVMKQKLQREYGEKLKMLLMADMVSTRATQQVTQEHHIKPHT